MSDETIRALERELARSGRRPVDYALEILKIGDPHAGRILESIWKALMRRKKRAGEGGIGPIAPGDLIETRHVVMKDKVRLFSVSTVAHGSTKEGIKKACNLASWRSGTRSNPPDPGAIPCSNEDCNQGFDGPDHSDPCPWCRGTQIEPGTSGGPPGLSPEEAGDALANMGLDGLPLNPRQQRARDLLAGRGRVALPSATGQVICPWCRARDPAGCDVCGGTGSL